MTDGLTDRELRNLIYELHDHQDLSFGEITMCLPLSRSEVERKYEARDDDDVVVTRVVRDDDSTRSVLDIFR